MIVKLIAPVLMLAVLSACRPSEPPKQGANMPTVEELASDPERLKELRRQCKTERPTMGDVLCNRVGEATNQRFFGDGKVPYTPPKEPPKF